MAKTSSAQELKDSKTPQAATKKLDFLLDTIDSEVANLADVINLEDPISDNKTSRGERKAISLSDGGRGLDSLELDMDFLKETGEISAEEETVVNDTQSALEAMSDAEGEIEAMLSMEETTEKAQIASAVESDNKKVGSDLAKALDELLATREVDASKLLKKAVEPQVVQERESQPKKKAKTAEEQLPEDLFDDLGNELELVLKGAAVENQAATDSELEEDLLGNLEMDFAPGATEESSIKEAPSEAGISKDLFETTEQHLAMKDQEKKGSEAVSSTSSPDEELADLLTKKIEGLVNRLVEERLSQIAERVIVEKINKIFKSMQ